MKQFSELPIWTTDEHAEHEYLGTWFGCDVYLYRGETLVIRYGDDPWEYATDGNIGWDRLAPLVRVGGLGENRYAADVAIHGNSIDNATMVALAFLGRQFLDGRRQK